MKLNQKTGSLIGIKIVKPEDQLMIITEDGIVIRQDVSGISKQGRSAQGVMAMRTGERRVVAIAKVVNKEDSEDIMDSDEEE